MIHGFKGFSYRWFLTSAGRLGIEPRFTASKAAVLPLDDLPALAINNIDCFAPDWRRRSPSPIVLPLDDPPAQCISERAPSVCLHTIRRSPKDSQNYLSI